jgi:uncharacterized protein YyaL (SSP411 family)
VRARATEFHVSVHPYAAYADDYASMIGALIDLYACTLDGEYLRRAERLQTLMDAKFFSVEHKCYYSTDGKDESVLLRLVDGRKY